MAKSTIYGVHAVETALRNDAENLGQIWFDKRSRNDRLKAGKNGGRQRFAPVSDGER